MRSITSRRKRNSIVLWKVRVVSRRKLKWNDESEKWFGLKLNFPLTSPPSTSIRYTILFIPPTRNIEWIKVTADDLSCLLYIFSSTSLSCFWLCVKIWKLLCLTATWEWKYEKNQENVYFTLLSSASKWIFVLRVEWEKLLSIFQTIFTLTQPQLS